MSAELIGAKMLAPYYGSSLFVWATVMAVTLGGLALGYFLGGFFSAKNKYSNFLYYIVLLAAAFTSLMPLSSGMIISFTSGLSMLPSIVVSSLLILMPPVFLMGMVSPLIIEKLSSTGNHAGKTSGSIYAISTLGGIIATFTMGFYIIPNFGLSKPALCTGLCLSALPLWAILNHKKVASGFILFFILISYILLAPKNNFSDIKILSQNEGMLGQLMVVDYPVYQTKERPEYYIRMMLFNRVIQAFYNAHDSSNKYFPYVSLMTQEIKHQKDSGRVLLLGLGGGCVANELVQNKFSVDAVELDPRVVEAAREFFNLDSGIGVYVDDARRFINQCTQKYDIIIFDVFKGEESPSHLITLESLEKIKKTLNPNGILVINGYGFRTGDKSRGIKAIVHTVQKSGFYTQTVPSTPKEEEGNLLLFARKNKFNTLTASYNFTPEEISQAPLLTDDKPLLEVLNTPAVIAWRSAYIQSAITDFNKRNIPLFD